MSHDETSRRVFGVTHATIVRRILATFDRATSADVEAGATWYTEAQTLATSLTATRLGTNDLLKDLSLEQAASVIAALSPRTSWSRNVAGATALVTHGPAAARRLGCLGRNVETANRAKVEGLAAINGPKTNAFARNIMGDTEAVTVDVWACRVADLDEDKLGLKGAYDAVAHAYRLAARRRGVAPTTMQATTWIVARNGRAK
jgi:hypothetical protein